MKVVNELVLGNLKTKEFTLSLSDGKFGPWEEVLKVTTNKPNTNELEDYTFTPKTAQFVRFEVLSCHGDCSHDGGLQYIELRNNRGEAGVSLTVFSVVLSQPTNLLRFCPPAPPVTSSPSATRTPTITSGGPGTEGDTSLSTSVNLNRST